jgi:hypothetical protein
MPKLPTIRSWRVSRTRESHTKSSMASKCERKEHDLLPERRTMRIGSTLKETRTTTKGEIDIALDMKQYMRTNEDVL